LKYIGAGTVSVLGFLLATACGQGGPGGGGSPSIVDDDVPNSYEEPPLDGESNPPDIDDPPPRGVGTEVPGDVSGPPPGGGGAGCSGLCDALQGAGCLEGGTSQCVAECQAGFAQEVCADELLEAATCLYGLATTDVCDLEELVEDEQLLLSCESEFLAYSRCADATPEQPTDQCMCSCVCADLCTTTLYSQCAQSDSQCRTCDSSCADFCDTSACGASLIPAGTQAYCVSSEQ
jgi:hypothetical protein